jgi:hypothetical protein
MMNGRTLWSRRSWLYRPNQEDKKQNPERRSREQQQFSKWTIPLDGDHRRSDREATKHGCAEEFHALRPWFISLSWSAILMDYFEYSWITF